MYTWEKSWYLGFRFYSIYSSPKRAQFLERKIFTLQARRSWSSQFKAGSVFIRIFSFFTTKRVDLHIQSQDDKTFLQDRNLEPSIDNRHSYISTTIQNAKCFSHSDSGRLYNVNYNNRNEDACLRLVFQNLVCRTSAQTGQEAREFNL